MRQRLFPRRSHCRRRRDDPWSHDRPAICWIHIRICRSTSTNTTRNSLISYSLTRLDPPHSAAVRNLCYSWSGPALIFHLWLPRYSQWSANWTWLPSVAARCCSLRGVCRTFKWRINYVWCLSCYFSSSFASASSSSSSSISSFPSSSFKPTTTAVSLIVTIQLVNME